MSADVAHVWPEKDPTEKLDYSVDFEVFLTRFWKADASYDVNTFVRPNRSTGYEYECTTAGRSGHREPNNWPTTIGATITDGSVTWTCRALSTNSLTSTVSGIPTWTADTGLTVSGLSVTNQMGTAYIEGGSDGEDYSVRVSATLVDGRIITRVCVLPVRRAVRKVYA